MTHPWQYATSALLLASALSVPAHAQSVTFLYTESVVDKNLVNPFGMAIDAAGDVFVTEPGLNQLVEDVAGGGGQTTVLGGLNTPYGVALDAAGDIFLCDTHNNRVLKIKPGGAPPTTIGGGLSSPWGVAVNAAGDVFIADEGNSRVVKVPAGGGPQVTVGAGFLSPMGLTLDAAGDLFVADYGAKNVVEVPAGGGPQTVVFANTSSPSGVAVDAAGNVFIAYPNPSGFPLGFVLEVPVGGGAPLQLLPGELEEPFGVAVDLAGNIYISDSRTNQVTELERSSVNFGGVPVSSTSGRALIYSITAPVTFSHTATVLTLGIPGSDFGTVVSPDLPCTGTLAAGSTCAVSLLFVPTAPGLRMGAIQLTDSNGNVLVTTLAQGVGLGAAVAFTPSPQTSIGSGLNNPSSAALDGAGNLYVADTSNNRVVKIPPGGDFQTVVAADLSLPVGIAVDGIGDVFIADTYNSRVIKVPASGGSQTTVGTGLSYPSGVAVDGAGNVFIADTNNSRIVEVPATGGPQTTVGTGLSAPIAVAVDGGGNIYIADTGNNRVVKVRGGGGGQTTIGSGLRAPTGVSVDAAGDVYIADEGNVRVVKVPAEGSPQTTVGTDLSDPFGVTVDGSGGIYIAESGGARIVEIQTSQPPSLSFASAELGSTGSPQSIAVQNIGNQMLHAVPPGLSMSTNIVQVPGSGNPKDCTNLFTLAPGASCDLSLSFVPQSTGSLRGAAVLTDNALNGSKSTQTILLLGSSGLRHRTAHHHRHLRR